jgi:hypothetical protein
MRLHMRWLVIDHFFLHRLTGWVELNSSWELFCVRVQLPCFLG